LDRDLDAVIARSTLAKVVVLEVECLLGEPIAIVDIVDLVGDEECVDTSGIDVLARGWGYTSIVAIVEDLARAALLGRGASRALVADNIVTRCIGGGGRADSVPTIGRSSGISGIHVGVVTLGDVLNLWVNCDVRGICHKVIGGEDIAVGCIDKGFEPVVSIGGQDLNYVGESEVSVGLDIVLQGRYLVIVGTSKLVLGSGDSSLLGNGGSGGRDLA
jgi:hypothetical protein